MPPIEQREIQWNADHVADFRAHEGRITQGPLAGSDLLLMTSTGARSGQPRIAPLGYHRDGERYVIVGSNSGAAADADWLANIKADPSVIVEVGTERFKARATITNGAERRRLLDARIAKVPIFGRYEQMTKRPLPVVVLERIEPAGTEDTMRDADGIAHPG